MACLTENQLSEYIEGVLPEGERAAVEAELARCDDCRALLCTWARTTLRTPVSPSLEPGEPYEPGGDDAGKDGRLIRRGDMIDRFEIESFIGAGGMGLVFAGRDVELDRPVAIKVVHPQLLSSPEAADRLVDEARAMAAVRHANVVSVFQAGRAGSSTFLAMERIDGEPLSRWLEGGPSTAARLDVFARIARGLAAIHGAGLTHRDVKPGNILVDGDGTPKLADFGLAVRGDSDEIAGTPAYMAPEVRADGRAGPAADQYSFSVSLDEAFPGRRGRAVSAIVARGTRDDPADRWPDMAAVAERLERASRPRRWRRSALLIGGGAVAALAIAMAARDAPAPCGDPDAGLDQVWDAPRRERARAAFAAAGRPWAARSFDSADRAITDRVESWRALRHRACAATRIDGEQTEAELGRQLACLRDQRRRLEAAAGAMITADARTVDAVAPLIDGLPHIGDCAVDALAAAEPPDPDDPIAAAVAGAQKLAARGDFAAAIDALEPLRERVTRAANPVLRADYHHSLGAAARRQSRLELAAAELRAAAASAAEAGDDLRAARSWRELALVVGYYDDRPEAGMAYLENAASLVGEAPRELAAELLDARGLIHAGAGEHEESERAHRRALAIRRELGDPLPIAESLYLLGRAHRALHRLEDAEAELREALAIRAERFGELHPDTIRLFGEIGQVRSAAGDNTGAASWFERAVSQLEAVVDPGDPALAGPLSSLGTQQLIRGDYDAARETLERALAIRERTLGRDDIEVGRSLVNLASLAYYRGDYRGALERYRRALDIGLATLGTEHLEVATIQTGVGLAAGAAGETELARGALERAIATYRRRKSNALLADALDNLARVEAGAERWRRARELAAEALPLREATLGREHPDLAFSHGLLGELALEDRELDAAESHIARAIELREKGSVAPQLVAETRFVMAKIRWRQGRRGAARALARRALVELGDARPDLAAMIREWLGAPR
jgi:tetratricopeptide (TPR) repeat protein